MFDLKEMEKKEKELLKKIFLTPIAFSVLSVILAGILVFLVIFRYEKEHTRENIQNVINLKKEYIKDKVLSLSQDVDNALKLTKKRTKEELKRRVDDVYIQLLTLVDLNLSKDFVITYLNGLNKYKNKDYIFAYDAKTGLVYVHKIKKFIGKNTKEIILKSGKSVFERNKEALEKNGGFYNTYFYKPDDLKRKYLKINYIKKVTNLNMIIGSGEYVDDIKKKLIEHIYQRIQLKRFDDDNYFFILKPNGELIVNGVKEFIGKNVLNLKDKEGKYFVKEMIRKALESKNGAFVTYNWINPATNKKEKKLSYVIYNKNLDAVIGAGLYYKKDIEKIVESEKKRISKEFFYINISLLIGILVVLVISIFVSLYFSEKLKAIFSVYNESLKELLHKIKFEADHDNLTQVLNRRAFEERLKREIYRSKRYNIPLSIAMIDVDHFKKINDTYGHDMGDKVLKELASFMKKNIRKSDIFARWGGEEFMLIMPHTKIDEAKNICEKLKYNLQENEKTSVKFTISCGITELRGDDNMESFLKRVDEALYKAKNSGRDRIEVI